MTDKKLILKTFNDQFGEFMNDISVMFPGDVDIRSSKMSLGLMRKANPKLLIGIWDIYISSKYSKEIDSGNLNFFFDKDYTEDMTNMENAQQVLIAINRLRHPISKMNESNQAKVVKYLQNLKKLCELYQQM
jgi:hypothetical protein